MRKTKMIVATLIMLSILNPLSILAEEVPLGGYVEVGGKTKVPVANQDQSQNGTGAYNPGTGGIIPVTGPTITKEVNSNSTGTSNKPYTRYVSTSYNETGLKNAVATLMKSASTNSTKYGTFKTPVSNGEVVRYDSNIPDYVKEPFVPFYIKTYRSIITTKAVNKQTIKTTKKDVRYNWNLTGPDSWNKDTTSNSIKIKFTQVGTYTLTFLPFEESTNTVSQTITGYGLKSWPEITGKKTETLYSTSTKTGPTTTKSTNADTSRKQVWIFEVTSSDIDKDIIIKPDPDPTPPGGTPPGSVTPGGSSKVEVIGDIDVTIVE